MPGPLLAALPAAATALGGVLGFMGGERSNNANAKQAEANRAFQERMSSTSYQRAVADMKAAGLNPALAYQQGGASSPVGATAKIENTLAEAAGNAEGAARTFNSTRATQAQTAQMVATTKNTEAQTEQLKIESAARLQDIQERARLAATNSDQLNALLPFRKAEIAQNVTGGQARERLTEAELETVSALRNLQAGEMRQRIQNMATDARAKELDIIYQRLGLAGAANEANAQQTAWKKYAAPYMNDAKTISGMISDFIRLGPRSTNSETESYFGRGYQKTTTKSRSNR